MLPLFLAGGAFLGTLVPPSDTDFYNHTLRGERVLASQVVCRDRWGTPMLPDGKGSYSLVAPINEAYIAESLIQPPLPCVMTPFRPAPEIVVTVAPVAVVAP